MRRGSSSRTPPPAWRGRGPDRAPPSPPDSRAQVHKDRAGRAQIYRMPVTGGRAERLSFEGRSNARASYSPDGKQLVLVHQDEAGFRIATMDLETKRMNIHSAGPLDESPSFAPNGVVIIYSASGRQGAELATVAIDTGIETRLRQEGDVREPAWSPFHK